MNFYQVYSNDGPGVRNGPAAGGGLWFKNEIQNCLAQVLEIWYVALPGAPLPSLFKPRSQGPRWPLARGPRFEPYKCIEIY